MRSWEVKDKSGEQKSVESPWAYLNGSIKEPYDLFRLEGGGRILELMVIVIY